MNSPDTNNDKKYELILRIEIDYRPFIGFCIAEIRDNGQYARADTLPDGIIEQALALIGENNDEESKRDGWWIYWEYIPTDVRISDDDVPDFKEDNEAYFSLAIEEKREKFADACYSAFDKFQKK